MRVKVPVASIISALEARLAENDKAQKEIEVLQKKHEAEMVKHATAVVAALTKAKATVDTVSVRNWHNRVEISYVLPASLKLPDAPVRDNPKNRALSSWDIREIEQTLAILRMTTEPTVSATAYKNVAQFLA